MSEFSTCSSVSVSVFGDEIPLEQAIDQVFKKLQDSLNYTHSSMRELNMEAERGSDFKEISSVGFDIQKYIQDCSELFTELKDVVKQVIGKPQTEEDKLWFQQEKLKIKQELLRKKQAEKAEKERLKAEKKAEKNLSVSNGN